MARKDRKGRKDRGRKPASFRRAEPFREPRASVLIVCEGEQTEPTYFESLRSHLRLSTVEVEVVGDSGSAPISVVDRALELREQRVRDARRDPARLPYDVVYCVCDVDRHESLARATDKAKANGLMLILSNLCFEFWFLLHFERTGTAFINSKALLTRLKKHLPDYEKGTDYFAQLWPHTDEAIGHAESLLRSQWQNETDLSKCNPCTQAHLVVQHLRQIAEG